MWEPLLVWRYYARQACAILSVAAQIHGRGWASLGLWDRMFEPHPSGLPHYLGGQDGARPILERREASSQRWMLSLVLDGGWLRPAGSRPMFRWEGAGRKVFLGEGGLFGELAQRLMSAIARTDGVAICSACGRPYMPGRRPDPDRRMYCDDCRNKGRPQRDAARDYRRRKRAEERR
jgi:hypothetical protein